MTRRLAFIRSVLGKRAADWAQRNALGARGRRSIRADAMYMKYIFGRCVERACAGGRRRRAQQPTSTDHNFAGPAIHHVTCAPLPGYARVTLIALINQRPRAAAAATASAHGRTHRRVRAP